ncbi:MAG: DUF5753 domain-containing protein [Acidimicrobiales bacterium]
MTDRDNRRISPAVCRRELRRRLVRRRIEARHPNGTVRFPNRGTAASELGWSRPKQDFLETGEQHLLAKDLPRVFDVFEIPDDEQEEWQWLTEGAAVSGWWDRYDDADLSADGRRYLAYEWGSRRQRAYTGGILHGLVQTPLYAEARMRAGLVQRSSQQMARIVNIVQQRKAVLEAPDPLDFHLIFDESVLHRDAGQGVMAVQLASMLDLAESHPNVTLQVVPYSAGLYPALAGSFTLMEFGFPDDAGLVNLEPGFVESMYVEDTQQVYLYSQMFENMAEARATSPDETLDILRSAQSSAGSDQ